LCAEAKRPEEASLVPEDIMAAYEKHKTFPAWRSRRPPTSLAPYHERYYAKAVSLIRG